MRLRLLALLTALGGTSIFADEDFCPLHVGNKWSYEIAHIDPTKPVSKGMDHCRIRSTVERNGKTYFVFEQWGGNLAEKQATSYVRKDEKGAYTTFDRTKEGFEVVWLTFPLKVGASWKYDDDATRTVTGLENVTIGTVTYKNCYHIVTKTSDGRFTSDEWIAPKVGLVKSEDAFSGGEKRTKTLVKFEAAP